MPISHGERDEEVIVVGNGVAGYACAARLAKRGRPVTMIGPGLPHDRPPLSKRALRTGRLPLFADADGLDASGIRHLDGVVRTLDVDHHRVSVTGADGDAAVVEAPAIVWATGLRYPRPPIPGFGETEQNSTGQGLLSLVRLLERPGRRVIVVGAGLIGTETAATLASDHDVTLVDMVDRPLSRFVHRISELAGATLGQLGVRFIGGCMIDAAESDANGWTLHTSTHGELRGDVVISAAGFASSLPGELVVTDSRQLVLDADERLRVIGRPGYWACGDCVSFPHPRWGRIAIPHWDNAIWSGRHVAESILGSEEPYVREPYFFSDIGPLRIQQVGQAERVCEWNDSGDSLIVGRDHDDRIACALLIGAPARLNEARSLVESAA
ncbi:MAG TPA: NAD(P)/FAD-dependent oxidoreductase [Gaiellales bacterium]|nr:NAD(P)/FAD-dependent oxidoreductase [Gaiellales bacterium]